MRIRGKAMSTVISLVALAGVTACAEQYLLSAGGHAAPEVAVTALASPNPPATAETEAPVEAAPIPEPTVAKVQKWVKIYSGPSARNVNPPRSTRGGSHTVELNVTPSALIGSYVSDGAGRTLYRFDDDSASPPRSTCNGDCARTWPPLLIKSPGKIFPKGLAPKILGYVERTDGHCQVTISGHPVYFYSGDTKAGDFRGQGLKGTWFAVTATGDKTHYLLDPPPAGGRGY